MTSHSRISFHNVRYATRTHEVLRKYHRLHDRDRWKSTQERSALAGGNELGVVEENF